MKTPNPPDPLTQLGQGREGEAPSVLPSLLWILSALALFLYSLTRL